jgi:hypothetical protein
MGGLSTRTKPSNGWIAFGMTLWAMTASLASSGAQAAIAPQSPGPFQATLHDAENTRTERFYASGVQAYHDGDMKTAIYWWRQAASEGHLMSQYNLGSAYASGVGVPVDMAEAVHWWRLAALQGSTDAQYNLGVIYYEGRGTRRNVSEASMWWYMAAVGGDPAAQYRLGYLAAIGEDGAVNLDDARTWWKRAADQGFELATKALELLERREPGQHTGK